MTGLNYQTDRILEIAVSACDDRPFSFGYLSFDIQVLITNGNLDVVDNGLQFIIHAEKSVLDKFDCVPPQCGVKLLRM